jgi:hypothetical protein
MFAHFERLNIQTGILDTKPKFRIEIEEITSNNKKIISFNKNRCRSNTLLSNSALAKLRLESLNEELDVDIPILNPLNNLYQKLNFGGVKINKE